MIAGGESAPERASATCIIGAGMVPRKDMADDFIDLTDPAAAKVREQLPPEGDGGALRLAAKRLENGDFHYAHGLWLGTRLRRVRRYREFSQLDVAQRLKLSRTALSHIENGRRGLDALELKRLAGLYQYPVSYFTGEVNPAEGLEEVLEPLLQTAADLFRHDREEVRRFAEYLRARKEYEESS